MYQKLPDDLIMEIMHNADINSLIMLSGLNKNMNKICDTKHFRDNHYQRNGLPKIKDKKYKFRYWISDFIQSYNSLLLAKYLLTLDNFKYAYGYHYGGTAEVLEQLTKMKIKYKLNEYIDTSSKGLIKLTKSDIGNLNPIVNVNYNKKKNKYIIGLEMNIIYDDDYDDDDAVEYEVEYAKLALLTYNKMLIFLYSQIKLKNFIYESRYGFNKPNYDEYKKKLKLPIYISKK